jgi:hypothetical protein
MRSSITAIIFSIILAGALHAQEQIQPEPQAPPTPIPTQPQPQPEPQPEVLHFRQNLNDIFDQQQLNTNGQQIIYGTVEAFSAYKFGTLVPRADSAEIAAIKSQLIALDRRSIADADPVLSTAQRAARERVLRADLRKLEGNIATRMSRGTARLLLRGGQVFLVLDIISRVYVLSVLEKDPGFVPLKTLFCNEVDCDRVIEQAMYIQTQAYREAQRQN